MVRIQFATPARFEPLDIVRLVFWLLQGIPFVVFLRETSFYDISRTVESGFLGGALVGGFVALIYK